MPPFERRDGELFGGARSLTALAERFGTPLYVYDLESVEARVASFRDAFRQVDLRLAYSVKANGNLAVLGKLAALGVGADIVSLGELHRALRAGVEPGRIYFSGVGKAPDELEGALEAETGAFHVESAEELRLLARMARAVGRAAPVAVRVNPDILSPAFHEYTRTGHAGSKFGVPVEESRELYRFAADDPFLDARGVAVHIGSQILDPAPYVCAAEVVLSLAAELRGAGIEIEYVDLGGGFGVGYEGEPGLDPRDLAEALVPAVGDAEVALVLEPGRTIVAEAGVLVTRVLHVKRSGGRIIVVADAGMTELLRPSHYGGFHRIEPVRTREGRAGARVDIVGPVCETGDFLARDRELPLPERGELLAVRTAGAYGFSMASNYNSRRRPAEVVVEGGRVHLARRRESLDDLVRGESLPSWITGPLSEATTGD